jgi:hypothetical protein
MSEEKEQTVNIDGTEHKVNDLSKEQVRFVNHVTDLDRRIEQLGMSGEQAQVSRKHFMGLLTESLKGNAE